MLEEIPYETIINILAPLLSMGDFGKLCLQSRYLNEIFSSNLVWKNLYLRSLQGKLKITSDSIHSPSWRYMNPVYARLNTTEPCGLSSQLPLWYGEFDRVASTLRTCSCISPADFTGLRECGVTEYRGVGRYTNFTEWQIQGPVWLKQQQAKILEYNISQGRGEILCTNIDHYIPDTLQAPSSCRNLKSYRKSVLSKLLTAAKNDGDNRKAKRDLEKMLKEEAVLKERIRLATEQTYAADKKIIGLTTALYSKTI